MVQHQFGRPERRGELIAEFTGPVQNRFDMFDVSLSRLSAKIGQVGQGGDPSRWTGRPRKAELVRRGSQETREAGEDVRAQGIRLANERDHPLAELAEGTIQDGLAAT